MSKAYAIIAPDGTMMIYTIDDTERRSQLALEAVLGGRWETYDSDGYRCIPVEIREAQEGTINAGRGGEPVERLAVVAEEQECLSALKRLVELKEIKEQLESGDLDAVEQLSLRMYYDRNKNEAWMQARAAIAAAPSGSDGAVAWADKLSFEDAMRKGKGCDVWPKRGDTKRECIPLYTRPLAGQAELADAERYRWLRDTAPWHNVLVIINRDDFPDDIACYTQDGLDTAIDAAMLRSNSAGGENET